MKFLKIIVLILFPALLFAQNKIEKVQLQNAESLEKVRLKGQDVHKLMGNVIFKHEGMMLYCDSAYLFDQKNEVDCFGRVRMVQGDTVTLTGEKLHYNGNTKKAVVTGKVILQDRKMTLTTDYLDYDTKIKLASYQAGGKIVDEENVLTSERGYYNTQSKLMWFKKNVKLVNEKQQYNLTSDTLQYHTITKIATFKGPSRVEKEHDVLIADHGTYDTEKGQSIAMGRAKVESGDYLLEGDRLDYDEKEKAGVARGNVKLTSKENNVIVLGDMAHYWGKDGIVRVVGTPLVKNLMEDDTLYMIADTLISVDRKNPKDTSKREKYLRAFHHVKVYKTDLQARCDSLVYHFSDSTIYFYTDPVMWNSGNQIVADSINILMKNKKIYRMNANVNSFIISQDTIKNFNQVRGKKMVAYFKDDKISRVNISGNGQSIYYAMEEDSDKLIGLNKADCSNIAVRFENGELSNITYMIKPDAKFIPPDLIVEDDTKLKGFQWRITEKPEKDQVAGVRDKMPVVVPFVPEK